MSTDSPSPQDDTDSLAPLRDMPRSERVTKLFRFEPTEYQAELLDYAEDDQKAQAAPKKGRQVGATLTAAVIAADRAVTHPDADTLITAPGQSTSDEMFRACKQHFHNSPFTLEQFGVEKDNERTWEFDNGHRILSRTLGNVNRSDQAGNRGLNPSCVIVDEAAYGQDRAFLDEIEGFFITHDEYEYYLFSTPAGKSGYFYNAVEGKNADEWFSPHWPTRISPYAEADYIEQKRQEYTTQRFEQELLGEFAEGEDSYLSHSLVKPCVYPNPLASDAIETRNNALRYLGVDPARSGTDRMVIYDLDELGVTRNIWAEETTTGTGFVGHIQALQEGHATTEPVWGDGSLPPSGYQAIAIEENAVGGFGADILESRVGDVIQMVTTGSKSKQAMYQRLKKDLEEENLALPNHRTLIDELTSLQYRYTEHGYLKISHPPGGRDDFPDGLCLANAVRNNLDIVSNPRRDYAPEYFRIDLSDPFAD